MFLFVGASQISIYISAFVLGTLLLPVSNSFITPKQLLFRNLSIWLSMAFLSLFSLVQEQSCSARPWEWSSQLWVLFFSTALATWPYPGSHMVSENGGPSLQFCPWHPSSTSPCGGPLPSVLAVKLWKPNSPLVGSNWDVNCAGSSLSLLAGWSPRVEWRKRTPLWEMLHERTKSRRHQLYLKGLW